MKKMIISIIVIGLLLTTSVAGVNASIAEEKLTAEWFTANTVQQADWTFITYLAADNNLAVFVPYVLKNIKSVGSSVDVEIVAQVDTACSGGPGGPSYPNIRYHVSYTPGSFDYVEDLGELNMGDPQTLIDFVEWAINTYPAEHYFLTLNSHGGGWGGICPDETDEDVITMEELEEALSAISDEIGDKLDILFFNACAMGQIEVYYYIDDYVEYAVSSEGLSRAGQGENYPILLEALKNSPQWEPEKVADETAKCFSNLDYPAAIKTNKIQNIVDEIQILANGLLEDLSNYSKDITYSVLFSPCYYGQTGDKGQVDLYRFVSNLKNRIADPKIKNAAEKIMNYIDESVIGFYGRFGHGLNILAPGNTEEDREFVIDRYYKLLEFSNYTNWGDLVSEYEENSVVYNYEGSGPSLNNPVYQISQESIVTTISQNNPQSSPSSPQSTQGNSPTNS